MDFNGKGGERLCEEQREGKMHSKYIVREKNLFVVKVVEIKRNGGIYLVRNAERYEFKLIFFFLRKDVER